jgi:hypothetical protein
LCSFSSSGSFFYGRGLAGKRIANFYRKRDQKMGGFMQSVKHWSISKS